MLNRNVQSNGRQKSDQNLEQKKSVLVLGKICRPVECSSVTWIFISYFASSTVRLRDNFYIDKSTFTTLILFPKKRGSATN